MSCWFSDEILHKNFASCVSIFDNLFMFSITRQHNKMTKDEANESVAKTPAQLKKEAEKAAKMKKFAEKQEKQAQLAAKSSDVRLIYRSLISYFQKPESKAKKPAVEEKRETIVKYEGNTKPGDKKGSFILFAIINFIRLKIFHPICLPLTIRNMSRPLGTRGGRSRVSLHRNMFA
jgi:hypothetical protein